MQWNPEIEAALKRLRQGTQDDTDTEILEEAGCFDDDSDMYPHDEHVGREFTHCDNLYL